MAQREKFVLRTSQNFRIRFWQMLGIIRSTGLFNFKFNKGFTYRQVSLSVNGQSYLAFLFFFTLDSSDFVVVFNGKSCRESFYHPMSEPNLLHMTDYEFIEFAKMVRHNLIDIIPNGVFGGRGVFANAVNDFISAVASEDFVKKEVPWNEE